MNSLDLATLIIVAVSAVFGLAIGFIRGLLFVAAVVGAVLITRYGYDHVYGMIEPSTNNQLLSGLIAIAGTFLVSLIVLVIVAGQIGRLAKSAGLSLIDRTIGFIFAGLCACAALSFAFLLFEISLPNSEWPAWIKSAKSTPFLASGADYLRTLLPESVRAKAASAVDEGGQLLDSATTTQRAIRALQNPTAAPSSGSPTSGAAAPNTASTPSGTATGAPAQPATPGQSPTTPTYKPSDQRELDRLINNQR